MRKLIWAALAVIAVIVEAPLLFSLQGDAQVHLAVAESFVKGRPFQYNPGDPLVMASTSPFWTILLIVLSHLFGNLTPIAVKAVSVLCWGSASYLLWKVVTGIWQWSFGRRVLLLGLWLSNTTIILNALGGLENVLSAVQLLLVYFVCARGVASLSWQRSLGLGLLLGWTVLTRLDCGFFASVCVCSVFVTGFLSASGPLRKTVLAQFAAVVLVSNLFILPWYLYQYSMTGSLVSVCALARLYGGRRESWMILKDGLYFHPKAVFTLVTVFLPLTLGAVLALQAWGRRLFRARGQLGQQLSLTYPTFAAASIVAAGIFFYSFVVGAGHFGRYFLPIFPFFFILGFQGIWVLGDRWSTKCQRLPACLSVCVACYLTLGSGLDYYRRGVLRELYSPDLMFVVKDHRDRVGNTDRYLAKLGVPKTQHITIAVTEVQIRYYLDDRIKVVSLDGRTSGQILKYTDRSSGMPDFQRYLEDMRPDFVGLGDWCEGGGWMALARQEQLPPNLLCEWEQRAGSMKIGDSFDWNGNSVVYVALGIMRIAWRQ